MVELLEIDNVILHAPDVGKAAQWYEQQLGLALIYATPQVAVLATQDRSGPGLVVRCSDRPSTSAAWFKVVDAPSVASELGGQVFPIATGLCVEITDPWANTFGFADYSTAT